MIHNELASFQWLHSNEKSKKKAASLLDCNIYDLIRYIFSSNADISQLENDFFVKLRQNENPMFMNI